MYTSNHHMLTAIPKKHLIGECEGLVFRYGEGEEGGRGGRGGRGGGVSAGTTTLDQEYGLHAPLPAYLARQRSSNIVWLPLTHTHCDI